MILDYDLCDWRQLVQYLFRSVKVDGFEPLVERRQTVFEQFLGQMDRRGVAQVNGQRPHGRSRRLQFGRKRRVVRVRLEFHVRRQLALVHIHS